MRIGIVGATGMLGHHTALAAQRRGHEVVVLHRPTAHLDHLRGFKYTGRIVDLDEPTTLAPALRGLDGVINAAAYYPTTPRPWREEVARALTQMNAFYDACEHAHVGRIVYLGGSIALPRRADGIPGDENLSYADEPADKNPYLQVKWAMDLQARERAQRGLPVVIGIPTMSFGEYDYGPTTGRFIVEIANRTMAAYVHGQRNVVYAGDAGRGLVLALEKGRAGQRYLLTGDNITMEQLVELIARIAKVEPPRAVPLTVARAAGTLQELRYHLIGGKAPRLSSTAIAVMASGQFLDGGKAREELDYHAEVPITGAIERALNWFKAQGYVRAA